MIVNLKAKVAHEDGWLVINSLGYPIARESWHWTRHDARKRVKDSPGCGFKIVRARRIVAWKEPA